MSSIDIPQVRVFAPGVLSFPSGEAIDSPMAWQEYLGDLSIMSIDGVSYAPLPAAFEKTRSSEMRRPTWAGDQYWHLDLCREGNQIGRLVTAIYYAEGDESAPGTDIVDTTRLREAMEADGVFARAELDEDTLSRLETEFSASTYFTETLPRTARQASRTERAAIAAFLESRQIDGKEVPLQKYADYLDARHPPVRLPLLQENPFDPQGGVGLMFDVERGRDIIDPRTGLSYGGLLYAMRLYLDVKESELRERGVIDTIEPEPGKVALFTREGSLHRAQAGNEANRKIFLGWLATKPDGVALDFSD